MSFLRGDLTISRVAWGIARQFAGIETQHHVLHVPFDPLTDNEAPDRVRSAVGELESRGLASGRRIGPELVEMFHLFGSPAQELHGWIGYHDGADVSVLAASDGRSAVRAVLDEQAMHLSPIQAGKLAESVVMLMPDYPASHGRSLTLPRELYATIGSDGPTDTADGMDFLIDVKPASPEQLEVDALKALLAQPRRGGGRFSAAARDRMGRGTRSRHPLTTLDLASGRYFCREAPNATGQLWLTVAPAGADTVVGELYRLLRQL